MGKKRNREQEEDEYFDDDFFMTDPLCFVPRKVIERMTEVTLRYKLEMEPYDLETDILLEEMLQVFIEKELYELCQVIFNEQNRRKKRKENKENKSTL